MVREGVRLGIVVAVLAWATAALPWAAYLFVVGVVPGLWWSTAAWEADEVDARASLGVVLVAAVLVAILPGVRWDWDLAPALWVGTQLARIRLIPVRVDTVDPEVWARRNAHRYHAGRPNVPVPDLSSSDPYTLVMGAGRGRQPPPDPYEGVPDEHQVFVAGERP